MMKTEKIPRLNTASGIVFASSVLPGRDSMTQILQQSKQRLMEAVRTPTQNSFTPKPALSTTGLQLVSICMII